MPPRTRKRAISESKPAGRPAKRQATAASVNAKVHLNQAPTTRLDIYVFGAGESGELGLGSLRRSGKKPTDVRRPRLNDLLDAATVGVVQLDVGGMHTIALTNDGKILTWGVNDLGALGRDTKWVAPTKDADASDSDSDDDDDDDSGLNPKESTPIAIPTNAFPKGVKFVQVAASDSASFALTEDGQVYGWGCFSGAEGPVGFTKEAALRGQKEQWTPILIDRLTNIVSIAAGGNHCQALDKKGTAYIFGTGGQFQLGREIRENYQLNALTPTTFGLPRNKIKSIACGTYHNFAIDKTDRVYAWGLNNFGQTGVAKGAGDEKAFVREPTILSSLANYNIASIQGGSHHSIACTEDGTVLTWGRCDDGQPGVLLSDIPASDLINNDAGRPKILKKPTVVSDITGVSVAAGIDDCIALNAEGKAYSWGFGASFRTGQGTEDVIKAATLIDNSAIREKKLTFAGCGGLFSVLAGPAELK